MDDGREANRVFWRGIFDALPDLVAHAEDVIAPEIASPRGSSTAHPSGNLFGIPATGRVLEMRSIDIWRITDGFFVEHWDELNVLDMLRQIGLGGLLRAGLTWPVQHLRDCLRAG